MSIWFGKCFSIFFNEIKDIDVRHHRLKCITLTAMNDIRKLAQDALKNLGSNSRESFKAIDHEVKPYSADLISKAKKFRFKWNTRFRALKECSQEAELHVVIQTLEHALTYLQGLAKQFHSDFMRLKADEDKILYAKGIAQRVICIGNVHREEENMHAEKAAFLWDKCQASSTQIMRLGHQKQLFPFFQGFIKKIEDSYGTWDGILLAWDSVRREYAGMSQQEALQLVQMKLNRQHGNLLAFSKLFTELAPSPAEAYILQKINLDGFFETVVTGDVEITAVDDLKKILYAHIATSKKKNFPTLPLSEVANPESLAKLRQADVLTKSALYAQKWLIDALRDARQEIARVNIEALISMPSTNKVCLLRHSITGPASHYNQPFAFIKLGISDCPATRKMEQIIWELAILMGWEELFTPTLSAVLHDKKSVFPFPLESVLTKGAEKRLLWVKSATFEMQLNTFQTLPGCQVSLQPAQGIMNIGDYANVTSGSRKVLLKRASVIQASVVALVMGMRDAHQENIRIDASGNIKFFDNAASLSHSNDVILWGNEHRASYRCALFDLPESYTPLSSDELENILSELHRIDQKLGKIFDKDGHITLLLLSQHIESLPPGWFDPQLVYRAMCERIARLRAAVQKAQSTKLATSLRDLTLAVHPTLKLFMGLAFIRFSLAAVLEVILKIDPQLGKPVAFSREELVNLQRQMASFDWSFHTLEELSPYTLSVRVASQPDKIEFALDPALVQKWCLSPALSIEEVFAHIIQESVRIILLPAEQRSKHSTLWRKDINYPLALLPTCIPRLDLKDFDYPSIISKQNKLLNILILAAATEGIPFFKVAKEHRNHLTQSYLKKANYALALEKNAEGFKFITLFCKHKTKIWIFPVDFMYFPGLLRIKLPQKNGCFTITEPMSMPVFKKWVEDFCG